MKDQGEMEAPPPPPPPLPPQPLQKRLLKKLEE